MSLEVLWGKPNGGDLGRQNLLPAFFFRRQEIVNIDKRQYTSFSGCEYFSVVETLSGLL